MNGRSIWEMSLALHLRMFRARGKSLEKSAEQHNSARAARFAVFCMEIAAHKN